MKETGAMTTGRGVPSRAVLAAFALVVLIASANFVAVRYSNRELPPFWGAAVRFGTASLLLFGLCLVSRVALPRGRALAGAVLYGVLAFAGAYALAYWGLLRVQAGLGSVVMALVPLMTVLLAPAHRLEPFRWRGVFGAVVAAAGVGVVFREGLSADAPLPFLLAMMGAALCAAESGVVVKWFPRSHPFATNAVAMACGAALLVLLSAVAGEPWVLPAETTTWLALGYLVLVGSCLMFVLWVYVLARWTVSAVSYQFVLMPVFTIALGAALSGERVTLVLLLGSVLVLAGVYAGAIAGFAPATKPAAPRAPIIPAVRAEPSR